MTKTLSGVTVSCITGNIAAQNDMKAVVNAANAQLRPGGGVAGAIHRAAGPGLEDECRPLAPIQPGEAVITHAHNLPNTYVIHCLGPVYAVDTPEDVLLADCYRNALNLADQYQIDSIAFPALSTGAFGYPLEEAAEVALRAVKEMIPQLNYVNTLRFVLFSDRERLIHEQYLESVFG